MEPQKKKKTKPKHKRVVEDVLTSNFKLNFRSGVSKTPWYLWKNKQENQ